MFAGKFAVVVRYEPHAACMHYWQIGLKVLWSWHRQCAPRQSPAIALSVPSAGLQCSFVAAAHQRLSKDSFQGREIACSAER